METTAGISGFECVILISSLGRAVLVFSLSKQSSAAVHSLFLPASLPRVSSPPEDALFESQSVFNGTTVSCTFHGLFIH